MRGAPLPTGKADIRLLMKQLPESNTEPKWRGRAETWLTHTLSLLYWVTLKCCVPTGLLLMIWKAFILSFTDRAVDSIIQTCFLMPLFFPFICFVIEYNNYCQMPQLILSRLPLSCRGLCVFPPSSLISIVKIAAAAELKKKKKVHSACSHCGLYHWRRGRCAWIQLQKMDPV